MCDRCVGITNEVMNSSDYETMTEADKIELAMRMIDWLVSDATENEKGNPHNVAKVLRGILADLFPERSTDDNE